VADCFLFINSGSGNWLAERTAKGIHINNVANDAVVICQNMWEMQPHLFGKRFTASFGIKSLSGNVDIYISPYAAKPISAPGIYTLTFDLPDTIPEGMVRVGIAAYTGSDIEIEYIKVEPGNVATPYAPADPAVELLRCQRLYEKSYRPNSAPGTNTHIGIFSAPAVGTRFLSGVKFSVPKRTTPNARIFSAVGAEGYVTELGSDNVEIPIQSVWNPNENGFDIIDTGFPGVLTSGTWYQYHWVADAGF
jgi:hypothetical protein